MKRYRGCVYKRKHIGKHYFNENHNCIVYKADEMDAKVRKLKMDIEEARGDSSLQIFLCEQFIEQIVGK